MAHRMAKVQQMLLKQSKETFIKAPSSQIIFDLYD